MSQQKYIKCLDLYIQKLKFPFGGKEKLLQYVTQHLCVGTCTVLSHPAETRILQS